MKDLIFTEHALQRMRQRNISCEEVFNILKKGKKRPAKNEWLDYFIYVQWIHVIVKITDEKDIMIITVFNAYENYNSKKIRRSK